MKVVSCFSHHLNSNRMNIFHFRIDSFVNDNIRNPKQLSSTVPFIPMKQFCIGHVYHFKISFDKFTIVLYSFLWVNIIQQTTDKMYSFEKSIGNEKKHFLTALKFHRNRKNKLTKQNCVRRSPLGIV